MKKDEQNHFSSDQKTYYWETLKDDSSHYNQDAAKTRNGFYKGKQSYMYDTSKTERHRYRQILDQGSNCSEKNGHCNLYNNPGYIAAHTSANSDVTPQKEFTLQVIPIESLQCTNGQLQKNSVGAFRMSGDDVINFFSVFIPSPPPTALESSSASLLQQASTEDNLFSYDDILNVASMDLDRSQSLAMSDDSSETPTSSPSVAVSTTVPIFANPHPAGVPDPFDSKYSVLLSNIVANSVEQRPIAGEPLFLGIYVSTYDARRRAIQKCLLMACAPASKLKSSTISRDCLCDNKDERWGKEPTVFHTQQQR
jgi:hypothetical protein